MAGAVGRRGHRTRGSAPSSVPGGPGAPRRPAAGARGCERARPLRARSASRASRGRLCRERPGNPQPQSCRRRSFVRRPRRLRVPPAGGGETRKGKEEEEGKEAAAQAHSSRRRRPPPGRCSAVPRARPARAPRPRPGPGLALAPLPLQPLRPARHGPARPAPPPRRRRLSGRVRGARRRLDVPGSRLGDPTPLSSPERAAEAADPRGRSRREARGHPGERGASEAERPSPRAGARSRHHARLEEEYPHLLAGGGAGER